MASSLAIAKAKQKKAGLKVGRPIPSEGPPPYRVWAPLLADYVRDMESEMYQNWVKHAEKFTKSSFVNKLMLSLTNRQDMWTENGFFPQTVATLQTEINLAIATPFAKEEAPEMNHDDAIPQADAEEDEVEE